MAAPVELREPGEGHMVDIHVEAHADGVGGDDVVDVAVLVERHLGVARARAQRSENHRRTPALAPDELGNGVDAVGREGDHGRARPETRDAARPGIGQRGEALAALETDLRQEAGDAGADVVGAEKESLMTASGMEQPVGEDMPPLGVGAELDLVHGHEIDLARERHRLGGADEVSGPSGLNLFFARDQRDLVGAPQTADAVVDFAGEKAERQPDDPRGIGEHPLHRIMGLAGVGRPQYRDQPAGVGGPDGRGAKRGCSSVHRVRPRAMLRAGSLPVRPGRPCGQERGSTQSVRPSALGARRLMASRAPGRWGLISRAAR